MPVDEQLLTSLGSTESKLRSLTEDLAPAIARGRPSPGKWGIPEILGHLTDAELVTSFRLRQILTTPDGTPVASYDQDAWVELENYASVPVEKILAKFQILRNGNLALLHRLNDEQCLRYGIHAERGRESVMDLMNVIAGHDVHHMEQIKAIARNSKPSPIHD